jgi:hypothetical protein
MNPEQQGVYRKHIYWLTEAEEFRLREKLKTWNIKMGSAKRLVCTPLDEINKISSVSPEVWNIVCARQGSWYRASEKNGLYLIISSFELSGYQDKKAATLTRSQFDPPRLAKPEDKEDMIRDPEFMNRIPSRWRMVDEREKRVYLRWAKRLGSHVEDYDFLYTSHTANHANFIKPRFFIKANETIIPYSIDRSAHLCSCCLELFQVVGTHYPKKMVAPCPGATIFARLKPDQYLLVES